MSAKTSYRIAGKFDGDLNLANWRFGQRPPKFIPAKFTTLEPLCYRQLAIAKFKTAKYLGRSKPPNILLVKFSGYTVYLSMVKVVIQTCPCAAENLKRS